MAATVTTSTAPEEAPPARRTRRRFRRPDWSGYALLSPAMVLFVFAFAAPLVLFLQYSFFTFRGGRMYEVYSTDAYRAVFSRYYLHIIWATLRTSLITMFLTVVVGYPLAYAMWRLRRPVLRVVLAVLVFMPLTVSAVVRSYGWQTLLGDSGPVNYLLTRLHLTSDPVSLTFNVTGVVIAMVHIFLPFVVFPIYSSLSRMDPSVHEAAADLGAGWFTTFRRITVPLSLPGMVAGAQISLTLALGAFITPAMLGGGRVPMLPITIYNDTSAINWPMAAAGGVVLLVMSLVAVWLFGRVLRLKAVSSR